MTASAVVPGRIEVRTPEATFLDPAAEEHLRVHGYAVMDVLDADEVAAVRAAYAALRPDDDQGLAIDYIRPDRTMIARVRELTQPLWDAHLPRLFADHRCAFTTFVTKHPGGSSHMYLHEDRSFVDERIERAGTLWIPLVDVGPDLPNGGLQLVPGSHRLATAFSGSNTQDLFRPYEDALREALITLELRAGQAVYYDTRTLHASPENETDEPREAIACAVVRREADLVHAVATGRRHRRLYRVGADFFVENHPRDIERSMPDDAELVDEWDEEPEPAGSAVADLLGLAGTPPATVVPPHDVDATGADGELRPVAGPARPRRRHDLELAAADLPELGTAPSRHRWEALAGEVGLLPADRPDGAPLGLAPRSEAIGDVDVVLLGPGARVRLEVGPTSSLDPVVDVTEAPVLGAGAVDGDGPRRVDLGDAFALDPGSVVTWWNDGPGPLALAVSMVPRRAPRATALVAAVARRRPARAAFDRDRRAVAHRWAGRPGSTPEPA